MGETLRGALLLGLGAAACFSCSLSVLDGLSGGGAGAGAGGSVMSDAATLPDASMIIEPIHLTGPDDASMVVADDAELIDDGSSQSTTVVTDSAAIDDASDTAPAEWVRRWLPRQGLLPGLGLRLSFVQGKEGGTSGDHRAAFT